MAQAPAQNLAALARGFGQLSNAQKIGLVVGLAAVVALAVVAVLWARQPEFRVLYSNLSDRDGGEVIAALAAQNIPYKVAEGGTAILVPAPVVYDTRLRLASQGLPRGGAVGFELMETQKFGVSQFAEQVNFQRALAGELSRTIQAMSPVQNARVHLAIPRPTVFVREQQRPSASVLVSLYPGRKLDEAQVTAIQHLVASSVPELSPRSVTVVDQTGNLLSVNGDMPAPGGLDATQLKYLHALEAAYAARIENILQPILGRENVRAQVTANLDFSQVEQTSETFKPNPTPQEQSLRSQQTIETTSSTPNGPSGVPGALSNQPPGAASAPITTPNAQAQTATAATPPTTSSHRESTVNYEVDKTIRHIRNEVGAVKRLSVAVVVNQRRSVDKDGKATLTPLTEQEMTQIGDLVREAMGYSKERGDTVNVVNAAFSGLEPEAAGAAPPFWRAWLEPANLVEYVKYALVGIVVLYLWFGFLRPTLRDLVAFGRVEPTVGEAGEAAVAAEGLEPAMAGAAAGAVPGGGFESDLQAARDLARQDPRIVANVVKDWVGRE
jgi:flagellar M-ring protein FliF